MALRRVLVATSVAFGLLASGTAGAAAYSLDGRKKTTKIWKATLGATSVPVNSVTSDPLTPSLADCTENTCDVHELRLSLPAGTSWGRLTIRVTAPRDLQLALVLYDKKGEPVDSRDALVPAEADQELEGSFEYTLEISSNWFTKGTYTLAVHNRGGTGEFKASVEWVAKRPDRKANLG